MQHKAAALFLLLSSAAPAPCQTEPRQLVPILEEQIQAPEVTAYQLRRYLLNKIPRLPAPVSSEQWNVEAKRLRERLLTDVVFRGWPKEWVDAPPRFEDLGLVPSGKGYRMRKLRFDIVPGFESTAILYEPAELKGKVPAILNVNGHVGATGKAVEYKQKRCINQALQGILSLNLEWLGSGELSQTENQHSFGHHLDLVGANAVGLFYLAMRRGLDYLYAHPMVDRGRIGMTGLSGGGWQTIVLSALDERINVGVPVAGFASYLSRLERMRDVGDIEQNATDMFASIDFAHLVAMRAPHPTLLIYNAEDNCCFRAPFVKRENFDAIIPFFRLYGQEDSLAWHENTDPADHNYQLDNRLQSYRFFAKHFGLAPVEQEVPVGAEIKSVDELTVGLPKDNLTILGLAKKLAGTIERPARASSENRQWREEQLKILRETVRFREVDVDRAWIAGNTKRRGLETVSYRFALSNGLSAVGTRLKAITTPQNAPASVVISDGGRKTSQVEVSARVNRGEQVLALDLLFTGEMGQLQRPRPTGFTQALAALGERPLGIEAAQLIAVARWIQKLSGRPNVRLEATGMRSQVAALAAVALQPDLFSELVVRKGIPSLRHLLDAPIEYRAAPELFCFGLYRRFDVDDLARLASGVVVRMK